MDIDGDHVSDYLNEDSSPYGARLSGVNPGEVLRRAELDLAYSSEKLMNLEMLLMQVAGRANDYETFSTENQGSSTESFEKALEFDLLSGILNSEAKELDDFMTSLQIEILEARQNFPKDDYFDESLHDAEELLKQSQDRVADLRMQSNKFEGMLAFDEHEWSGADDEMGNGHLSSMSAKWKLQTVEQQRHALQMLEKSLARELDLEKKFSDSRCNEEELKMKLHYAEQEAYYMEESIESILERTLESEIVAELFVGISKELQGKLQVAQFTLSAILEESEMGSKLQEIMIKLPAEENASQKQKSGCAELDNLLVLQSSSKGLALKGEEIALDEQLNESESCLQQAKTSAEASQEHQNMLNSEVNDLKNVIEGLRENVLKAESKAEDAEAKCTQLTKTNMELSEELGLLRNNGADIASILERKLQDSDAQLEHAKASVEAMEEQQSMLYSALTDMENLINDLKEKVSKAENRAESAESKCTLLTETNLELNDELSFLRGRSDCLETSLHQSDDAKVASAKDIGIRTKIITDLVTKLALERERLQLQIAALARRNKLLEKKCLNMKDCVPSTMNHNGTMIGSETTSLDSSKEAIGEILTAKFQVEKPVTAIPACETEISNSASPEDNSSGATSKLETVRTIEATQLSPKYVFMAFLILFLAVVAFYLVRL